jgi:hypothetical protein
VMMGSSIVTSGARKITIAILRAHSVLSQITNTKRHWFPTIWAATEAGKAGKAGKAGDDAPAPRDKIWVRQFLHPEINLSEAIFAPQENLLH